MRLNGTEDEKPAPLSLEQRQKQWDDMARHQAEIRRHGNCPIDIVLPPRPTGKEQQ